MLAPPELRTLANLRDAQQFCDVVVPRQSEPLPPMNARAQTRQSTLISFPEQEVVEGRLQGDQGTRVMGLGGNKGTVFALIDQQTLAPHPQTSNVASVHAFAPRFSMERISNSHWTVKWIPSRGRNPEDTLAQWLSAIEHIYAFVSRSAPGDRFTLVLQRGTTKQDLDVSGADATRRIAHLRQCVAQRWVDASGKSLKDWSTATLERLPQSNIGTVGVRVLGEGGAPLTSVRVSFERGECFGCSGESDEHGRVICDLVAMHGHGRLEEMSGPTAAWFSGSVNSKLLIPPFSQQLAATDGAP